MPRVSVLYELHFESIRINIVLDLGEILWMIYGRSLIALFHVSHHSKSFIPIVFWFWAKFFRFLYSLLYFIEQRFWQIPFENETLWDTLSHFESLWVTLSHFESLWVAVNIPWKNFDLYSSCLKYGVVETFLQFFFQPLETLKKSCIIYSIYIWVDWNKDYIWVNRNKDYIWVNRK